eukprot:TRINITY_DN3207_c0_g1_i4.p1 TRINITY_DN3207_c0_g1~~TRINITY_DN3207_c0_g1_i4.p1  ORF type:complete len:467 (+),score=85.11 TRINITY_DN3207_c0_g1_i4:43-1443(+)
MQRGRQAWEHCERAPEDGRIIAWFSSTNRYYAVQEACCTYAPNDAPTTQKEFRVSVPGVLMEQLVQEGATMKKDQELLILNICKHPSRYMDTCDECSLDLKKVNCLPDAFKSLSFAPSDLGLTLSAEHAQEYQKTFKDRLHSLQKLILVLDLDETLIHTTDLSIHNVPSEWVSKYDLKSFKLHRDPLQRYTKLRPGVSEFLASASKLYEIYVFTLGARDYGRRIAEIIDPGFKYLDESKVFTVEDAGGDKRILQKRLDCILPFDYNMVVIVDDRIDVWSAHEDNVLQVRKFVFFPPGRPSDSETKRSREGTRGPPIECNSPGSGIEDNALPRFSNLLKQVHDLYYGHTEHGAINNTQECIDIVLSEVLSGVTILFSGVFNLKNDPRENWLWKRAEKYGAECSLEWSDDVTHLVAFKDGSQKVHEASEKSVFIVSLNWLVLRDYSLSLKLYKSRYNTNIFIPRLDSL